MLWKECHFQFVFWVSDGNVQNLDLFSSSVDGEWLCLSWFLCFMRCLICGKKFGWYFFLWCVHFAGLGRDDDEV